MFVNDVETDFSTNKLHRQLKHYKQWYADNDNDCSCSSSGGCSSYIDEINEKTSSFDPMRSMDIPRVPLNNTNYCPTAHIPHLNTSSKHRYWSINCNRPSTNESITANRQPSEQFAFITENHETNQQQSPLIDLEYIDNMIDQSYLKIPIFYNSIKQTKLDGDFILSVNHYLDRLKANIYKDLIRRETLLRNGKIHTDNLITLIRCICQISYEQSLETSNDSSTTQRAVLFTMTAIEYILQRHYPQNKPLFNYILNEYISMWLHENLRVIQEDFSIIVEHGTRKNFRPFCICLFHKLKSLCAMNWERLQMLQNYRLTHFHQLMKVTSVKLEINKDFILLFGKLLTSTVKRSAIPITSLYAHRIDKEMMNIEEIHDIFRKSIANILMRENQKSRAHPPDGITSPIEVNSAINVKSIHVDLHSEKEVVSQTSIVDEGELDEVEATLAIFDHQEKSVWNVVSETHTQSIEPVSLPHYPPSIILPMNDLKKQQRSPSSESKLISPLNQQIFPSHQSISPTLMHESSPSQSNSSLSQAQMFTQAKHDTSSLVNDTEHKNSSNESVPVQTNLFNAPSMEPLKLTHQDVTRIDSTAILNTEVNELVHFLTNLANSSSSSLQQEHKRSSLLEQLGSCIQLNNIDSNSIIKKVHQTNSPSFLCVDDPLFLAEFTRVLRKELEDAQILRDIDRGELKEDSQNIGYLSFETRNRLKLSNTDSSRRSKDTAAGDNIDQDRVFIEVTHDPSRCTPTSEVSFGQCHLCTPQHQQFNHNDSPAISSTNEPLPSMEPKHSQQRMYWNRSKEYSTCKDCTVTPSSLFCARKLLDKNTYSITVEHNDEFS